MKARDFCNNIAAFINQQNTSFEFGLQKIEANYALSNLHFLLNDLYQSYPNTDIQDINLQPLLDLLAERWELIRRFDFSYQYNNFTKINVIYGYLAHQLARLTGKKPNEILMPTIKYIHNEVTYTNLNDNDLNFHHLVISDDGERFIEILPCLYAAQESGVLKHTGLKNGLPVNLTTSECGRVISHSQLTEAYYSAIVDIISYRENNPSFGAALLRLEYAFTGIKYGGVNGTDNNAGNLANEAISQFNRWFAQLQPHEKNQLLEAHDDLNYTFNDVWMKLTREGVKFHKQGTDKGKEIGGDSATCIHLMANNIKKIIDKNPWLFDCYPEKLDTKELVSYANLMQQLNYTYQQLRSAFNTPYYTPSTRTPQMQARDIVSYLPKMITTHENFKNVLLMLPDNLRLNFITQCQQRLLSLIPIDQEGNILNLLPLTDHQNFRRQYNAAKGKGIKNKYPTTIFWEHESKRFCPPQTTNLNQVFEQERETQRNKR